MKSTTVAEVLELPHDSVVHKITGRLIKLYPSKTGESAKGPWRIQNGVLHDDTGDIKVMITGAEQDVPKEFYNKDVEITAYDGAKGWSGVYAADDDYKGTVTRILKITKTGSVKLTDAPAPRTASQPARSDSKGGSGQPQEFDHSQLPEFHSMLAKIQNAFYFIKEAAEKQISNAEINGITTPDSHRQAECSTAFIKLDRAGLIDTMTTAPAWVKKTPAVHDP